MKAERNKFNFGFFTEKIKKNKYLVIVIIVGCVLMLLPSNKESVKESDSAAISRSGIIETEFSLKYQEEKLEKLLSEVEGAGKVKVMLTVGTSTEQIIAENIQESGASAESGETSHEKNTETVTIKEGDNESPIPLKYIYPEYTGAVVVSEGASEPSVKLALTEAVSSLTGLKTDKISIIKMKVS